MENPTLNTNTTMNGAGATSSEGFNMSSIKHNAEKWIEMGRENSTEMMEKSVEMAKKYPVHTALGAGALGMVTGLVLGRLLK